MNRGQQLTFLGSLGLVVGALLPWATITSIFGTISKAGYEGDGIFTGGIGLILLIASILAKGKPGKRYSTAGAILGIILGAIVLYDLVNVSSVVSEVGGDSLVTASTGSGLYLTLVGAVLVMLGGIQSVPGEGSTQVSPQATSEGGTMRSEDPENAG